MAGMNQLTDAFVNELKDVYHAEKQITKALPKMIKAASNDKLRTAFEQHLEETREQVGRLEECFQSLDLPPKAKTCQGMMGILEEGAELLEQDGDPAVLDAMFIAAAQRVEHYEITAYGTLIEWAKQLNLGCRSLLEQNLSEEKAADQKLTRIAEQSINKMAASGREPAVAHDRGLESAGRPSGRGSRKMAGSRSTRSAAKRR